MIVQKKQLLEGLREAMPGVDSDKAVLQGADTFIFHNGNIFTYNDVISVSVPINQIGIVSENIEGAVNGKDFFQVVSKLPSEEITFEAGEKCWFLKSGKSKVEMTLQEFDFEKRLQGITPDEQKWIKINDDFVSGIRSCKISQNKTAVSGVFFSGKYIIGTDGFQVNRYNLDVELPKFWLSEKCVDELLKMTNFVEMQVNEGWGHFKCENGTIFSVKTLNADKYPIDKIDNLLNASNPTGNEPHGRFPKTLAGAIDRAVSLSISMLDKEVVRLGLSKEVINVSSERASGKYEEEIAWEDEVGEFAPIKIYVDAGIMFNICNKALDFFIIQGSRKVPRLFFRTNKSVHIMSTFNK